MRLLREYLKSRSWAVLLLGACTGVFAWVLSLYRLQAEAAAYGGLLCLILLLICGTIDFIQWRRRTLDLEGIAGQAALLLSLLPEPKDAMEAAYRELILELDQDRRAAVSALDARNRETLDYYTMWVHQIKTPIAAMGLILQDDETERGLALRPELFRGGALCGAGSQLPADGRRSVGLRYPAGERGQRAAAGGAEICTAVYPGKGCAGPGGDGIEGPQ